MWMAGWTLKLVCSFCLRDSKSPSHQNPSSFKQYELHLSKNTSPQSSCTCLNIFKWTICNQNSSVSRHHYTSDSFCPISNVPTLSSAQTQCLALGTALQGGCCTLTRLERKTRGGMKIGKIWKWLIQIEWRINMVVRKARGSCKQLIDELARDK